MEDGGYQRPEFGCQMAGDHIRKNQWKSPLYWEKHEGQWYEFTLYGLETLNPAAPVAHISYYEADAFAHWAGKRLPSEKPSWKENCWKYRYKDSLAITVFFTLKTGEGQYYGSLWEWTASPYLAYPRFKPLPGSLGEYNGKFMCNQWVLRGGSCVTPLDHIRPTYRNFFYPHDRWQFAGIRLAEDL